MGEGELLVGIEILDAKETLGSGNVPENEPLLAL
jgi:hypothetical protein